MYRLVNQSRLLAVEPIDLLESSPTPEYEQRDSLCERWTPSEIRGLFVFLNVLARSE